MDANEVTSGKLVSNDFIEWPYRCKCATPFVAILSPFLGSAIHKHTCHKCKEQVYMTFQIENGLPALVSVSNPEPVRGDSERDLRMKDTVWAATYAQAFAYLKLKDANDSQPNARHAAIVAKTADEAVDALASVKGGTK